MTLFKKSLLAAVALGTVLGVSAAAGEQDKEESKGSALKACGPSEKEVYYVADTDKKNHPSAEPAADKAIIYVLRPSLMGNKVQTKLAVDGQWKGVTRGNNYFFFTLDPGEHYFCSQAENHSLLTLKVEAGKTYYLQQHIRMGMMKARNELNTMTEEEGIKKLADAHPSTWTLK
jgi:Protein of unknown function (DUF2846)